MCVIKCLAASVVVGNSVTFFNTLNRLVDNNKIIFFSLLFSQSVKRSLSSATNEIATGGGVDGSGT